jgi:hypothetical protein
MRLIVESLVNDSVHEEYIKKNSCNLNGKLAFNARR